MLEHVGQSLDVNLLRAALSRYKFSHINERKLQDGIESALNKERLWYKREVRLDEKSRIDFLVELNVGVEIKIGGSLSDLTMQASRYLQFPQLVSLLVVTTRAYHRDVPTEIAGKPVRVLWMATLR